MRSPSIVPPGLARRVSGVFVAMLPTLAGAAPAAILGDQDPSVPEPPAEAPIDQPPPPPESQPPSAAPPTDAPPDGAASPAAPTLPTNSEPRPEDAPATSDAPADPPTKKPNSADAADADPARADVPAKPKKKKKPKQKQEHKVNRGTEYRLGLYPSAYVQGPSLSVGAHAGLRQRLEPKKNHHLSFGLDYAYEPFSTKTLGFPEEDETSGHIARTLVQPIHVLAGHISRRIVWSKLVTTTLDLEADAWWPMLQQHQRLAARLTPGIRIGRTTGFFGELTVELYYKKFPHYFIDVVQRRIDQEGATPTGAVGYNFRKLVRLSGGFAFDFTHYLDAHYNAIGLNGAYVRSHYSKNYLDYIPFAELLLRPVKGLRIRARYAFERQRTQHYDRVMTGRDEFGSLTAKFFEGYYDYRRHRVNLWLAWEFRDRLRLAAAAAAWVRHFDVYEARTADNFWTGQLRVDAEIEASLELAVRVATIRRKHMRHDFSLSLLGSHVSRTSNQQREVSLATNFDITRVFLGFEVRGH